MYPRLAKLLQKYSYGIEGNESSGLKISLIGHFLMHMIIDSSTIF